MHIQSHYLSANYDTAILGVLINIRSTGAHPVANALLVVNA